MTNDPGKLSKKQLIARGVTHKWIPNNCRGTVWYSNPEEKNNNITTTAFFPYNQKVSFVSTSHGLCLRKLWEIGVVASWVLHQTNPPTRAFGSSRWSWCWLRKAVHLKIGSGYPLGELTDPTRDIINFKQWNPLELLVVQLLWPSCSVFSKILHKIHVMNLAMNRKLKMYHIALPIA